MEKLPMCRICLVQNVRMFLVANRNLHQLYEKLTDIPFVTEDSRPILACFFCCAKLKQCYRMLRQCLEAEELFAQMMNEDNEPNPLVTQDHFEFCSGFIKSPTENISIVDECQRESIAIKKELPAVCGGLDDIIEPKEEHQSDELEPENLDNSCVEDVADHSESDLEDDVLIMEFKTEVEEEQGESKKKRRARETERATVAKKRKLETRRTRLEDAITAEQTRKGKSNSKVIRITQKRAPAAEKPKLDTPRIKIEEAIAAEPKKNELSDSEMNENTQHHTPEPVTEFKKYFTDTKPGVNNSFSEKGTWTEYSHTGEKPYKCDLCQCCFSHKGHLTRHVRRHTGEKLNKCEMCQRSFSQFSNLKRHLQVHNREKPYKCDLCQRCFNDKRDLSKHIRIHNGEKPFKCNICQLSINDKRDLIKHIRKHTGEKHFKCDICQRSFSYSSDLKKHVRIHTGEKPYRCEICQRSFNIKGNLKKHFRIHTGEKPNNVS